MLRLLFRPSQILNMQCYELVIGVLMSQDIYRAVNACLKPVKDDLSKIDDKVKAIIGQLNQIEARVKNLSDQLTNIEESVKQKSKV